MSSPPPLLGPSVLRHLRMSLLLVHYLWTSVHQPQSLRISAGVRQGEIWSLTKFQGTSHIAADRINLPASCSHRVSPRLCDCASVQER
ncbi:hypothetical protein EV363DRAFT_1173941 [Boletus edulis]|nr:hypothetical protein EV363DRAFT_1173941 [Boletus edulis]